VVSDDPSWLYLPEEHYAASLTDLPASVVIEAARQLPSAFVPKKRTRSESVKCLLLHFCRLRAELDAEPDEVLFSRFSSIVSDLPLPSVSRLCVISGYIEMLYGEAVAAALRRPYNNLLVDPALNHEPDHTSSIDPDHISKLDPHHVSNLDPDHTPNLDLDHNLVPEPDLSWALLPAKELVQRLEKLDRADIVKCIGNLPRSHRPGYAKSRRQCCAALVGRTATSTRHWHHSMFASTPGPIWVLQMIQYTMTKGLRHLRERTDWMTKSNPQDQHVGRGHS
jgi:hypothetical protein